MRGILLPEACRYPLGPNGRVDITAWETEPWSGENPPKFMACDPLIWRTYPIGRPYMKKWNIVDNWKLNYH